VPEQELTDLATVLWGSVGGFVAWIVVFALPELQAIWVGGEDVHITLGRVLVAFLIAAGWVALGGVAAFLVGDATEVKHALAYGIAAEGIVGGLARVVPVPKG